MSDDNILTLSTGVKLEVFKPVLLVIREVERQINASKPQPPKIWREDKETHEENPNSPEYLEALQAWQADGIERQFGIAVITGTKINFVPENIPALESEDWQGVLSILGSELGKTKQERYLQWIKYVAAPDTLDFFSITARVMSLLGIKEEEVASAVETFRSDAERRANNLVALNGNSTDGNKVRTPTRRNRSSI